MVLVGDAMQLQPIHAGAAFSGDFPNGSVLPNLPVCGASVKSGRERPPVFSPAARPRRLDAHAQRGVSLRRRAGLKLLSASLQTGRALAATSSSNMPIKKQPARLRGDELLVLAHTNDDVRRLNEALRIK